jgi:polyferredoxin
VKKTQGTVEQSVAEPEKDRIRKPRRFDLLRFGPLKALLRSRLFQPLVQLPFVLLFFFLLYAGLFEYPAAGGLTVVTTWVVWWAGIVFLVASLGKVWCTVCPWNAVADWLNRLALFRRVTEKDTLSAKRPWPRGLRNITLATSLFVVLVWFELLPGLDMVVNPRATAVLGLLMLAFSVVSVLVYERSSFCRYGCLVGRVSGLYSMFAPLELRARDRALCRTCETKDCSRGNARGYACPTFEHLGTMDRNTYCILCTECIKTCPKDNVALNLRPVGFDLLHLAKTRPDEAYLALAMLSLTIFHIITMTPTWTSMERFLRATVGMHRVAAYTSLMGLILAVPVFIHLAVTSASRFLSRATGVTRTDAFIVFAYPLLPLALFGHLAHNAEHLLEEGGYLVPALTDPLNRGWDLLGLGQEYVVKPLLSPGWTEAMKLLFLVAGFCYALVVAFRAARMLYGRSSRFALTLVPVLLSLVAYALFQLWILGKPMVSRLGLG